ncbi:MAG: hypothetical protein KJZ83_07875 [Burkholderiaceae bacterium]|nr:hypothetical protein [Burkholderiaceae bacterium]
MNRSFASFVAGKAEIRRYGFFLSFLALLWMCTRPYRGIVHDSILYSFQAIASAVPERFSDDLYLRFGSQEDFSLYTPFLSLVIRLTDIETANLIVTIAGQILWIVGAGLLVRAVCHTPERRFLAFATLLLMPAAYGGLGVFSYAEHFQTPRIFAEGIALAGIAMAVRCAWRRSTALLALAMLVHPLMALPAVAVAFLLAARGRPALWLLPLVALAASIALAAADVQPFLRIRQTINGDWWDAVVQRSGFALMSRWTLPDIFLILVQFIVAGLIYWRGDGVERKLVRALTITVVVALLVNFVAADLLHNLLVLNLQFYRATWLLGVIANILAGALLPRLYAERDRVSAALLVGLALYALEHFFPLMIALALPQLALASAALWARHRMGSISRAMGAALIILTWLTTLCAIALIAVYLEQAIAVRLQARLWVYGLLASSVIAASLFVIGRSNSAIALTTCAIAVGISIYDQESPWQRLARSDDRPPRELMSIIEHAKNVYWESGMDYSWFALGRTQYFSCAQGTGSMFYERTALEYVRRGRALAALGTLDFAADESGFCFRSGVREQHATPGQEALRHACQSLPDLDLIVLLSEIRDAPRLTWKLPYALPVYRPTRGRLVRSDHDRFHFYQCKDFRTPVSAQLGPSRATLN